MFEKTKARLVAGLDGLTEWAAYKIIQRFPKAFFRVKVKRDAARRAELTALAQKQFTLDKIFISKTEEPRQIVVPGGTLVKGRDFVGKDFRPKKIQEAEAKAMANRKVAEEQHRIKTMSEFFTDGIFNGGERGLVAGKVLEESETRVGRVRKELGLPPRQYNSSRRIVRSSSQPYISLNSQPYISLKDLLADVEEKRRKLRSIPMDNEAMDDLIAEDNKPKSAAEMLGHVPARHPDATSYAEQRTINYSELFGEKPIAKRATQKFTPYAKKDKAEEAFEQRDGEKLLTAGKFTLAPEGVNIEQFLPDESPTDVEGVDGVTMLGHGPTHESITKQIDEAVSLFAKELEHKADGHSSPK